MEEKNLRERVIEEDPAKIGQSKKPIEIVMKDFSDKMFRLASFYGLNEEPDYGAKLKEKEK